jgi:hypothetical protein
MMVQSAFLAHGFLSITKPTIPALIKLCVYFPCLENYISSFLQHEISSNTLIAKFQTNFKAVTYAIISNNTCGSDMQDKKEGQDKDTEMENVNKTYCVLWIAFTVC